VSLVILLGLLAVLWIVVLAPSAFRRFSERQGGGSINHFHHELRSLKHAGPNTVKSAYRVGGAGSIPAQEGSLARPRLVLLRPVDDEQSADIEDGDGAHYARVGVIESPAPQTNPAQTEAGLAAYRRQQARQRCTLVLRILTAVAICTGILGVFSSFRPAWIITALSGLAALALVALIAHAREFEGRRQAPRPRREYSPYADSRYSPIGPAQAGYPGAWDDEEEVPLRRAAGGR
jgi:hypothetical protein